MRTTNSTGIERGATRRRRTDAGFTLLDAMAALTLFTIVAAVAAPLASGFLQASRLKAAGWSLANDLHRARQRAITENRTLRLTLSSEDLDPATRTPIGYVIAPVGGGGRAESRGLLPAIRFLNAPGTYVEFDPRGLAAGTVVLTLQGPTPGGLRLRVSPTGRVDFVG